MATGVLARVTGLVDGLGGAETRTGRTQVGFRRRARGGGAVGGLASARPVGGVEEVDDEVAGWLAEAYAAAGPLD